MVEPTRICVEPTGKTTNYSILIMVNPHLSKYSWIALSSRYPNAPLSSLFRYHSPHWNLSVCQERNWEKGGYLHMIKIKAISSWRHILYEKKGPLVS